MFTSGSTQKKRSKDSNKSSTVKTEPSEDIEPTLDGDLELDDVKPDLSVLIDDEEEFAQAQQLPSSSDSLWAQIDGDDEEFSKALIDMDMEENPAEEKEERYKPFFTGGPSINSRVALPDPIPEQDKLSFEDNGNGKQGTRFVCPVCDVEFIASEVGMNSHVEAHFSGTFSSKLF